METFWRVQFFSGTLHASPTPHSLKWSTMLCSLALWSHVSSKNKHSHKNRKTAESLDTRRIKTIQPVGQDWKSASEMLETSPDQWDAGYFFFCLFAWRQRPLLLGGRHSRAGMRGEFSFCRFQGTRDGPLFLLRRRQRCRMSECGGWGRAEAPPGGGRRGAGLAQWQSSLDSWLSSALLSSSRRRRLSPSRSPTTPVNLIRCCCPPTCSLCLRPRRLLRLRHRLRLRRPPSSNEKEKGRKRHDLIAMTWWWMMWSA